MPPLKMPYHKWRWHCHSTVISPVACFQLILRTNSARMYRMCTQGAVSQMALTLSQLCDRPCRLFSVSIQDRRCQCVSCTSQSAVSQKALTLSPSPFRVCFDQQCQCVECPFRDIACRPASSISQEALTVFRVNTQMMK